MGGGWRRVISTPVLIRTKQSGKPPGMIIAHGLRSGRPQLAACEIRNGLGGFQMTRMVWEAPNSLSARVFWWKSASLYCKMQNSWTQSCNLHHEMRVFSWTSANLFFEMQICVLQFCNLQHEMHAQPASRDWRPITN